MAGKTLGTNGDDATSPWFWLSCGPTNNALAGNIGVQSGTINLWGVQLEIGSVATPLDYGGSPQQQLAQCQRFYQKFPTFNVGGVTTAGVSIINPLLFPVPMRAAPTFVGGMSGGLGYTSPSLAAIGPFGVNVTATGNATNYIANVDIAASADL